MMGNFSESELVYLLMAFLALGVFLAFTGIMQLISRRESQGDARNRRMQMLAKGASTAEVYAVLKPQSTDTWVSKLPLVGSLPKTIGQSGLGIDLGQFLGLCFMLALGSALLGYQLAGVLGAVGAGVVIGFVIPVAIVSFARAKRMTAMIMQLPDALDLLARGLRVGHPLNTSIGAVAEEMADPVASEFGLIFDQVSFGDDLPDAFQEFAERVDLEDVYYLSSSVSIQHGTGGDLARMITTLANVLRARIAMRRTIKSMSAEGRLTGWFLSLLPVFIYGMTSITNPTYYASVSDDPAFLPMMGAIVFLTGLNALILRKLVRFDI